jgi:hypothetical protein
VFRISGCRIKIRGEFNHCGKIKAFFGAEEEGGPFSGIRAISEYCLNSAFDWPNPSCGDVVVTNACHANAVFILYDLTGSKVKEQEIPNSTNVVSFSAVPDGIYLYSITDRNTKAIKAGKLIIRK